MGRRLEIGKSQETDRLCSLKDLRGKVDAIDCIFLDPNFPLKVGVFYF